MSKYLYPKYNKWVEKKWEDVEKVREIGRELLEKYPELGSDDYIRLADWFRNEGGVLLMLRCQLDLAKLENREEDAQGFEKFIEDKKYEVDPSKWEWVKPIGPFK